MGVQKGVDDAGTLTSNEGAPFVRPAEVSKFMTSGPFRSVGEQVLVREVTGNPVRGSERARTGSNNQKDAQFKRGKSNGKDNSKQ